jgi:hypothetical protein
MAWGVTAVAVTSTISSGVQATANTNITTKITHFTSRNLVVFFMVEIDLPLKINQS